MNAAAGHDAVGELLKPELLEEARGLAIVARRLAEGALHGLHRSPLYGFSVEFAEHREYSPGDELKHLDWKVLGRSERYVIKQYEQETNLRALIVLDRSGSMDYGQKTITREQAGRPTKFEYGRVLAAGLTHVLLNQGDSVGLIMATDEITHQLAPRAHRGQLLSICATLLEAEPASRTDLPGALNQLAARLGRRSLVILISDLFDDPDGLLDVLGQLHHRGHEVLIFQVMDPTERDFDLGQTSHGVTVIEDMETGAEFEAEPHMIQHLVQKEIAAFLARLDDGVRRFGLHLVRCLTSDPVEKVLREYLHTRQMGGGRGMR